MNREKPIENLILSWLALKQIFAFKVDNHGFFDQKRGQFRLKHSVHRVLGISDIIGVYKGRPLAIEVKAPKGVVSEHQKAFLASWAACGGIAIVARSLDDVKARLELLDGAGSWIEEFQKAYAAVPSQDNEGYVPDRGGFKTGFSAAWHLQNQKIFELEARLKDEKQLVGILRIDQKNLENRLKDARAAG